MVARLGLSYLDLVQKPPVPHATSDPLSSSLSPRRVKPRTLGTQTSSHSQLRSRALGGSSSNPFLPDDSFRPPPWLLEAHPAEKPQWMLGMEMDHTTKVNNTQSQRRGETCKKKQRKEEYGEEESAVKKAFSSLVLMIRETQSYSLRLREILFYEDLKEVLFQVQREVHASFCWLFHRVFSCTPTLMLSLMLLLANFTVYSISNPAIASIPPQSITTSAHLLHHQRGQQVDDRSMAISRTTHLDGGGGGGGKRTKPVAGARDDSGRWWSSRKGHHHQIHWRGSRTVVEEEEEEERWKRFVEEAEMEKHVGGLVDREVRSVMVAPVWVEVEPDNVYPEFFKTELVYRRAIEESPNDQMLLSNYAQFLFLVAHDHSRAEHYFKRAIKDLPADAETLGRYANFLWIAKKDLSAAEETFLEAIGADPCNTAHAANYAHFLWSTGSEDTCFPLDGTI